MIRWLLLLMAISVWQPSTSVGQQQLLDFTKVYFRTNPFDKSMRGFLEQLTFDPEILDKKIQRRTRNQLYSFSGKYRKYNKFFFRADSVKVILMELPVPFADDLQKQDTILLYQISAYAPAGEKGKKDVVKEWEKIKRVWAKKFFDQDQEDVVKDNINTGQYLHLFLPLFTLSPLTVGWTTVSGPDRAVLTITLRLKQDQDYLTLPGSLNDSQ